MRHWMSSTGFSGTSLLRHELGRQRPSSGPSARCLGNVLPLTKLEQIFWYLLDSILMLGRLPALALCCAHPDLTNPLRSALEQEG